MLKVLRIVNGLLSIIDFNFVRILKLIFIIFICVFLINILYPIILSNISATYYMFHM